MGWSESERGLCKFHPEVNQFPGAVCSTCLAEKLTQFYSPCSSFPESKLTADFLGYGFLPIHSCSASSSSEYSSATSSPHHKCNESEIMGRSMSSTFMFRKDHGMKKREMLMKKSRSLAVVSNKSDHRGFGDDDVAAATKSGKKKNREESRVLVEVDKGDGEEDQAGFQAFQD